MSDRPIVVLMSWNLVARTLTFVRSDGKQATVDTPAFEPAEALRIVRVDWSIPLNAAIVYVDRGDEIVLEMQHHIRTDQLGNRLVVYLDQCHWSTIANARHRPHLLTPSELSAADQIEEWVRERKIALPLSSGHHIETTQYGNTEHRYVLAVTMMQLSRGWQMRSGLTVRRNEMYEAFRIRFDTLAPARNEAVFSLEPFITSTTGPSLPNCRPSTSTCNEHLNTRP
jgi:hypothetical protein